MSEKITPDKKVIYPSKSNNFGFGKTAFFVFLVTLITVVVLLGVSLLGVVLVNV